MHVYNHYYPDGNNQINTQESAQRLALHGPTIPVAVSVTQAYAEALERLGRPVPPAVSGLALIDTGASFCAVDDSVVRQLGVLPFGSTLIAGATGAADQPTYPASLSFPGTPIPNITFFDFIGSPLAQLGIIVLMGRNVLYQFCPGLQRPGRARESRVLAMGRPGRYRLACSGPSWL